MFVRLRRFLRRLVWLGLFLGVVLAGATWYLNARWLPEQGRALLARQLSRALHANVTIEELSYAPWNGFVLRHVRAVDAATREPILIAPYLRAQVAWLPLVATRDAHFRLFVDLQEPGPGPVTVVGRYGLTTRAFAATLFAQDFDVTTCSPTTLARLPAALTAAAGSTQLHLTMRPGQPTKLTLMAQLRTVTWTTASSRLSGQVELEATGDYLPDRTPAWSPSGTARMTNMAYEGLPIVQAARNVQGTARFSPDGLDAIDVTATLLDIPTQITGRFDLTAHLLECRLQAQPTMAQVTSLAPALKAYALTGSTTFDLQIHGSLQGTEELSMTAEGRLQDVGATLPQWPRPIEQVNGPWRYTHATQTLTLEQLSLVHDGIPANVSGTITRFADPAVHLTVTAAPPLAQLANLFPLLDAWECRGEGALTLTIDGSGAPAPLAVTAELQLRHGRVTTPWLPLPFTDVEGTLRYREHTLSAAPVRAVYDGRPYALEGQLSQFTTSPRLQLTLRAEPLTTRFDATWADDRLTITQWEGQFKTSQWRMAGQVTDLRHTPQLALRGEGAVALEDLAELPWPWAKPLARWPLRGAARIRLDGQGPLRAWPEGAWDATVAAPMMSWHQVPIADVACEFRLAGSRLTVPELRASPAGGRLVADGAVDFSTTPTSYTLRLQLTGMDLAQATQALPANKRIPSGTAGGQLELTSFGPPSTVRGQALVHAQGDNLANVPFLNQVLGGLLVTVAAAFKFGDLRQVTIQEVRGHVTIANEQLVTEDLALFGTNANFEVRGTVGFDKSLHLTIDPSLSKQLLSSTPSLGKAQEVVGQLDLLRIGRIEVTGTWEQPKFAARLVPLNELLGQFLPNLFNLLRRDTPE
ncbi:MAG: hypothetical protein HY597_04880 [Candidatus Omnitrophica bacterium]|nr:hypothetical protein [Candidatus Omnitrophota bacterium]